MAEISPETVARNEARHRVFWVGLIVGLLSAQVLLMFVAVYLAVADGSFAVEPDYYQKSLNWNAAIAQRQDNERLGWQAELNLGDKATVFGDRRFLCRLADNQGQPLDGAVIDVVAFPHARGSDRQSATLEPAGEGSYETTLRLARRGKWEFRIVVQRGPETFTWTELRDVEPPGASR